MLYEEYQKKVSKQAQKVSFLYHIRFWILSFLLVALGITMTLVSTKGMVKDDAPIGQEYTYGEPLTYSSSSFLSSARYQFRQESSQEWSEEVPYLPGNYVMRAYSPNNYGGSYYGKEQPFHIKAREATLSYSDQTIPYGAKPTITVDGLLAEDKLTDYKVSYSNYGAAPLLSSIQQGSIVIQNEKGEDRTACYHFTYPEKEATLTITKRKIGLTFASVTKDYDGKAITTKDYQVTSGSLLEGDRISLSEDYAPSLSSVGTQTNNITANQISIFNADKVNVTAYYDISLVPSTFTIHKKAITFEGVSYSREYDNTTNLYNSQGETLEHAEISYDSSLLADGEEVRFTYPYKDKLSMVPGTKELAFDVDIVNSTTGESTLPNYQVTKKPGTFTITKRKLEVKTTFSGSIEYRPVLSEQDHASLEQYSFESGTTLAGKDAFSLTASYAKEDSMDLSYSYHITHEDGSDASDCYEVIPSTITNPNAKVEKRKIALHTKSETLVYDGKSHTLSKDALTYTGHLHEGDIFVTSDTDQSFTDANETGYSISIPYEIEDSNKKDVTEYYDIDTSDYVGTLTIQKRPLSITLKADGTASSYTKTYDGKEVEFSIDYDSATTNSDGLDSGTGLVSGHQVSVKTTLAKIIKPSETTYSNPNKEKELSYEVTVKDADGNDVSANYDIKYSTLSVTVEKRKIAVDFGSLTKYYDGNSYAFSKLSLNPTSSDQTKISLSSGTLADGDELNFSLLDRMDTSGNDVLKDTTATSTTFDLSTLSKDNLRIYRGNEDVTECYEFSSITGTLTVKKATLVLTTSDSLTRTYDGSTTDSISLSIDEGDSDYPTDYALKGSGKLKDAKLPGTYAIDISKIYLQKGTSQILPSQMASLTLKQGTTYTIEKNPNYVIKNFKVEPMSHYYDKKSVTGEEVLAKASYSGLQAGDTLKIVQKQGTTLPTAVSKTAYNLGDYFEIKIVDSTGDDVTLAYTIDNPDFGTLTIKKVKLVYEGREDEVAYENLDDFKPTFSLLSGESDYPKGVTPTRETTRSGGPLAYEYTISKATVGSYKYSSSASDEDNTIDLIIKKKASVKVGQQKAIVTFASFTHYANQKSVSIQEMEKHVTVQNLVSGDSFEVVAKKDADGNALLTPTNEGTYSLKDYFDVHITRNGADRTAYYNFVDSLTAENPKQGIVDGTLTIKKLKVNVTYHNPDPITGANSGFTLSNTDNVTVTAEDSSAQNHLKYSLAYVNGNEPSLPGTYPFYLKELSYFVSEGSSENVSKSDIEITYADGTEQTTDGTYVGEVTVEKSDVTITVSLPLDKNGKTYIADGTTSIGAGDFDVKVEGEKVSGLSVSVSTDLTGSKYFTLGEHTLTESDLSFSVSDNGQTIHLSDYYNVTYVLPTYKVVAMSSVSVTKGFNHYYTYDGKPKTTTINRNISLHYLDGDKEVTPVIGPSATSLEFDFAKNSEEYEDVILTLDNDTTYSTKQGTLTLDPTVKDLCKITITKRNLTITAKSYTKDVSNAGETITIYSVTFKINNLASDDEVHYSLASKSYSMSDSSSYSSEDKKAEITINPEDFGVTIYNSDNQDVTDYYNITYVTGTLTLRIYNEDDDFD